MSNIILEKVSRYYKVDKSKFYALKNFSYTFPCSGLVSICGKSGSGKSTLLNLISLMDKPSEGTISFNGEDISKFNEKKTNHFRNRELGIIFQRYNLLEEETALFNIYFPLLIEGKSERTGKKKAFEIANKLGIKSDFLNKKAKDLSGGEKQRVAIMRALINNPSIVLADEPTGALDQKNSKIIMDLLKSVSKEYLVIMVSHNTALVNEYSDEIIHLSEGMMEYVEKKNKIPPKEDKKKRNAKGLGSSWPIIQGIKLFRRKISKNLISMISLSFGLIASLLIIGFSYNSKSATIKSSYKQIDYGVLSIAHQEKTNQGSNKISLIKESRPDQEEIEKLNNEYPDILLFPSINYFFPNNISITYNDELIDNLSYSPVYSFDEDTFDFSLIIKGRLPRNHHETIINESAYSLIKKKVKEPLDKSLNLSYIREVNYVTGEEERPYITDYFILEEEVIIVGVVDDFSFLTTPKLYYSFTYNTEILKNYEYANLCDYLEEDISMYDYLLMSNSSSEVSSFSYAGFYLDSGSYEKIESICQERNDNIAITSLGLERSKACLELVNACSMGMDIFLVISLIGTVLIIGIISFSSFLEDKRVIAIMFALGANKDDVLSSYLYSNVIIAIFSLVLSFTLSLFLETFFNGILLKMVGISSLIKIPYQMFLGYRFLFPILIVLAIFFVTFLSTYFPIFFASKISLKEELKEE